MHSRVHTHARTHITLLYTYLVYKVYVILYLAGMINTNVIIVLDTNLKYIYVILSLPTLYFMVL